MSAQFEASTAVSSISLFYYFPGFSFDFNRFNLFTAEGEGRFNVYARGLHIPALGRALRLICAVLN